MKHRSSMVVPKTLDVEIKTTPPPERKTSHGIVCACGSSKVRIITTIEMPSGRPAFMDERDKKRIRVVKRYCECDACKARFVNRSRVTTEELPLKP